MEAINEIVSDNEQNITNSFIIKETTPDRAYKLIANKIADGHSALSITRRDPLIIKNRYEMDLPLIQLADSKDSTKPSCLKLNVLKGKIKDFIKLNPKPVILLDRVDYLINMLGFSEVLKFIYSINDELLRDDATLIVNINPNTLTAKELSLLEQELNVIPKPALKEGSEFQEDLHEILVYLGNNDRVSYKHIGKNFSITKTTTRRRIKKLETRGLVTIRKNGRNKIVKLTEKGMELL